MGVAHEQPPAGGVFQLADVLADGGLLQPEAAGCLGEVVRLHNGEETFEVNRVKHGWLSWFMMTLSLISVVFNKPAEA
jgi:hypothetical protein